MRDPVILRLSQFSILSSCSLAVAENAVSQSEAMERYIQTGWTVLAEANGDLNGDDLADHAVVIEAPESVVEPSSSCDGSDDYSDAPVRRLIVELAEGEAPAVLVLDDPRTVLRSDQGGVFGDPFEDVSIENGGVTVRHYRGSRWRWGDTTRFRLEDGAWLITGRTEFQHDSISNQSIEYDYNALSGRVKVSVEESPDPVMAPEMPDCVQCRIGDSCPNDSGCYAGSKAMKTGEYWFDAAIKKRVRVGELRCWLEQPGFYGQTGFQSP